MFAYLDAPTTGEERQVRPEIDDGRCPQTNGLGNRMDQPIESFLADVLSLADCEALFRAQEPKKRMKDQAAHACRALCRARVSEELQRRRGTQLAEHLKVVRYFIDRPG
jgi:hypothetical protein